MKTITAMEMRKHMGAILDEVNLKSENFLLERAGKPIVVISPINSRKESDDAEKRKKLNALTNLSQIAIDEPRSKNIDKWLKTERSNFFTIA